MVGVSCYLVADQASADNVFQCKCSWLGTSVFVKSLVLLVLKCPCVIWEESFGSRSGLIVLSCRVLVSHQSKVWGLAWLGSISVWRAAASLVSSWSLAVSFLILSRTKAWSAWTVAINGIWFLQVISPCLWHYWLSGHVHVVSIWFYMYQGCKSHWSLGFAGLIVRYTVTV